MSTPFKGLGILLVLLLALYANLPTFQAMLPGQEDRLPAQMKEQLTRLQEAITPLQGLELALAEPQQNQIQLLHKKGVVVPLTHPSLPDLAAHFDLVQGEEASFLKLKPGQEKEVFITKVAQELNNTLTQAHKIKSLELGADQTSLRLAVEPGRRLSDKIEPLQSLLGSDMEMGYLPDENAYVLRKKQEELLVSLGLDLQGGMYQDIGVDVDKVMADVMQRTAEALEDRLIEDNVNYDEVQVVDAQSIEIQLDASESLDLTSDAYRRILEPGFAVQTEEGRRIITMTAEEVAAVKKRALDQALETIRNRIDQLGVKEPSIQRRSDDSIIIQLPGLKDPDRARRVIGQVAVLQFQMVVDGASPDRLERDQELLYEDIRDELTKEVVQTVPWVVQKQVLLQGSMIKDARVGFLQTGEAYVTMAFDDKGTELFAQITRDNVGKKLAIVLDGKIQSAPRINEPIPGGDAQITGSFSPEEASELALVLRSGALPAPIVIHEERTIGASLGVDSIRESLFSLILGFAAVSLFMIVYYRGAGVFAVIALVFNLLLIIAAMAYFQATLTLPGMAGIILTMGMAVDANVLIYERIHEEIRKGTNLRSAINTGFQKATITILDSNLTTILAAIILFQFGTGPIKGFAVTLGIGIAASMFTAVVVCRFLFELVYLRQQKLEKLSI